MLSSLIVSSHKLIFTDSPAKINKLVYFILSALLSILNGKTKVIITSAHTEYAIQGYEHNVIDYLLKPISFDRFFKAAQKALEAISPLVDVRASSENNEKFILVKTETKGKMIKVNIKDIYYIEGLKNYVSIYTQTDRIYSAPEYQGP